ncbi:MAG: DEAD/DEAH box helicase [Ardenticatenaceae bacterium]|nr:DEAD/DEAH box helicase [Ardenticatenaceae bacterium]
MPQENMQDAPLKEPMTAEACPEMIRFALNNAGWTNLTEVQAMSLPYMIEGRDLMVQAKTGSGKTGAFILPLTEKIDPLEPACQAMILVPTRELALQVYEEASTLLEGMGIAVVAVYGGVRYRQQIKAFEEGAHIVVGTPGRIIDHLSNGKLDLSYLQTLIFDEADRMLSMGFYPDMIEIKRYLPESKPHTNMFSATFPPEVRSLAYQFQQDSQFLNMSTDAIHVEEVAHVAYLVDAMDKDRALVKLLEIENPDAALIFCNTKQRVNYVAVVLGRYGFDADQLTSDLTQKAREKVLDRIREGRLRFLVATDVAARGIDIPHLTHSIQYELPEDLEVYIHRAGRTGRAGAGGTAFSLVGIQDELRLSRLVKQYDIEFDKQEAPTDADVTKVLRERLVNDLKKRTSGQDRLMLERSEWYLPLLKEAVASQDSENSELAQLIGWLLDEQVRKISAKAKPQAKFEQKQDSVSAEDRDYSDKRRGTRSQRSGQRRKSGGQRRKSDGERKGKRQRSGRKKTQ